MNKGKGGGYASGLSFMGVLTIVLVVLKLCKVIEISWLWVLSPIWISALAVTVVALLVFLIAALIALKEEQEDD